MSASNRRVFFNQFLALASASAAEPAVGRRPPQPGSLNSRQAEALKIRQDAAIAQSLRAVANHVNNGDETSLPPYVASFAKGLPHQQSGEVEKFSFEMLLHALATGKQADFESMAPGSGMRLVNPQSAFAFQMEGSDSHCLGMPPAPSLIGAEAAGEMVELYWQALARDVPFTDYGNSQVTLTAVQDLSRLSAFKGPTQNGRITPETLFRGNVVGGLAGPYISQFLWKPIPMNSSIVDQRYRVGLPGIDYMTSYSEWIALQNGVPPYRQWTADSTPRYIHNGRGLAEWVHYDFLYEAYHHAALILLNQGPDTNLNANPYLNPTNPYTSAKVDAGFGTFGGPDICCLLAQACEDALKAAWFQKWAVHRRLRPEEFGGRVHQSRVGAADYRLHADILNSPALDLVHQANGTYLLPQAFAEGCPLHPSYPAGHAVVSGACSVILKAYFDETQPMENCVVASADGLSLVPLDHITLTVGGEVNKLAFNIAMGRDFAGIHYRSDAEAGFRLGEEVAIAILEDVAQTYTEDFGGFHFTRLDGTPVSITRTASSRSGTAV